MHTAYIKFGQWLQGNGQTEIIPSRDIPHPENGEIILGAGKPAAVAPPVFMKLFMDMVSGSGPQFEATDTEVSERMAKAHAAAAMPE